MVTQIKEGKKSYSVMDSPFKGVLSAFHVKALKNYFSCQIK